MFAKNKRSAPSPFQMDEWADYMGNNMFKKRTPDGATFEDNFVRDCETYFHFKFY